MIAKLIYDSRTDGHKEQVVELPDGTSLYDIQAMFPHLLGVYYSDSCRIEILDSYPVAPIKYSSSKKHSHWEVIYRCANCGYAVFSKKQLEATCPSCKAAMDDPS